MQELRLVLIIVGLLAIAALLFHGLWTSKKEGKAKFGNKPHRKLESSEEEEQDYTATRAFAPEDDFEIIRKTRKEPEFADNTEKEVPAYDPLVDSEEPLPSFSSIDDDSSKSKENEPVESVLEPEAFVAEPQETEQIAVDQTTDFENEERTEEPVITEPEPEAEKEMEVLVLNVHCAGDDPFVGTSLFDSMKQNGLLYGEMDIFHRHADLSGTGKVLFSVANMMQPGTLQHDDPDTFTTQGISFFMTLPCFGEADQNFKLMLKTAQQIADDLGGNVLDDQRNLMTPDRLDAYRQQIRDFNAG